MSDEIKIPRFIEPRFRIFASVDLIGSSELKNAGLWAGSENILSGNSPPHAKWLSKISQFYSGFNEIFSSEWRRIKTLCEQDYHKGVLHDPTLWKVNGDELIFVLHVKNRSQVRTFIACWLRAVTKFRANHPLLSVKCTAWGAGFPLFNSEVIVDTSSSNKLMLETDDERLYTYQLLDRWYVKKEASDEEKRKRRHGLTRDYIGPSIDCGFRLAKLATERFMPISIELALFLSQSTPPQKKQVGKLMNIPDTRFLGMKNLDGILAGLAYPVFCLDTQSSLQISKIADEIDDRQPKEIKNKETISNYCHEYIEHNKGLIILPFIQSDNNEEFNGAPIEYNNILQSMAKSYHDFKQTAAAKRHVPTADEQLGDELDEEKAKGLVKKSADT